MVQEAGYQRQVAQRSAAVPLASPDDFGAQVGRGIEQLGGALHRRDLDAYKIERQQAADAEAADFNARFAKAREDADKFSIDARNSGNPGGAGHAEAAATYWETQSAALTEGITEDSVRQRAAAQLAEFGGRFRSSEYQYQEGARIGKIATDTQAASELSANRASRMHDPKAFAEEFSLGRQAIEAMPGVPDEVKDKLIKHHDEVVTVGYFNGLTRTSPAEALRQLNSGSFDDLLSPAQMERARNGAEVEVQRAQAVEAHQRALAEKGAREAIATIQSKQAAGIVVPDADLASAENVAKALGDSSTAVTLRATRITNGINRETQAWTPGQYDAEISRLRAIGAGKRSEADDVRLKSLETIAPGRKSEFAANPGSWAALSGLPAPAVDFADPGTWAARRQWQRTVSASTGRPTPFLQPAEVQQLQAFAEDGPGGRLKVINTIAPLGGRDAYQAMRQVAPTDDLAARVVLLQPTARASALQGAEARKLHPELVDGKQKIITSKLFSDRLGGAAALLDAGEIGAVLDITRNIYADVATKNGIMTFNRDLWNTSQHRALGGTRDAQGRWLGGVGTWKGTSVLLPANATNDTFNTRLSRMNWGPNWKGAPVFADGKTAMTAAQVKQYAPVARPDGRYEFHGPRGVVLQRRGGGIWTVDVTPQAVKP